MKKKSDVINLAYIKRILIQWTANCFTFNVNTVYIKIICIIETLYYWKKSPKLPLFSIGSITLGIMSLFGICVLLYVHTVWNMRQ